MESILSKRLQIPLCGAVQICCLLGRSVIRLKGPKEGKALRIQGSSISNGESGLAMIVRNPAELALWCYII